jgi:hypothetical protein
MSLLTRIVISLEACSYQASGCISFFVGTKLASHSTPSTCHYRKKGAGLGASSTGVHSPLGSIIFAGFAGMPFFHPL